MAWVVQFLVLAFTAVLWWLARRDLTARAADARAPAAEDWARLRVTVEQLMVELERRAVVAEQRIYEAEQRLRLVEQRLQASLAQAESTQGLAVAPATTLPAAPAMEDVMPAPERTGEAALLAVAPKIGGNAAPAPSLSLAERPTAPALPVAEKTTAPSLAVAEKTTAPDLPAAASAPPVSPVSAPPPLHLTPEEARYLPVYALADAGEADAAEISRQTGLPRGEIELVLSLRIRCPG